jgi:hypothetical protein
MGAALAALLAGCAATHPGSAPQTTQDRALARYEAYAGAPVNSFNWLGRFDSWEPLGDDHVLVYTRPNEAYLLKVSGPCQVRFATGPLGITSTNSTVLAGLDSIVVRNGPGGPWQCPIAEIRPVDVRRMKAEAHAQSEQPPPAQR